MVNLVRIVNQKMCYAQAASKSHCHSKSSASWNQQTGRHLGLRRHYTYRHKGDREAASIALPPGNIYPDCFHGGEGSVFLSILILVVFYIPSENASPARTEGAP
jgi:hypothetical protein